MRNSVVQKRHINKTSIWLGSASLIVTILLWLTLAPQKIGGQAAYILVRGTSMLPNYKTDDLVAVRHQREYAIGDVVAYQHRELGVVFHRIIDIDGIHFVLQGDNNDFLDLYRPKANEIIGIEWFHLPTAGRTLQQIRENPMLLALLAGGMAFFAFMGSSRALFFIPARSSRQGKRRSIPMLEKNQQREEWLSLIFFIAILFSLGIWFTYHRPLTITTQARTDYEQQILFNYSAMAEGNVYDAAIIAAGEPVFRRLSDSISLSINYQLLADQISEVSGTYHLYAELSDVNGWKRTIELDPVTVFEGGSADLFATLSFSELQAIIDMVQTQTGVERAHYNLRIVPVFTLDGLLGGQPIHDEFSAELAFDLSELELRALLDPTEEGNGLIKRKNGTLIQPVPTANTISVLSYELPISGLRQVSLIGFTLSCLFLGGLLYAGMREQGGNSAEKLKAHFGDLLIISQTDPFTLSTSRIHLESSNDLLRIAQQSGQAILHYQSLFTVFDGQVLYYVQQESVADVATDATVGTQRVKVIA